MKNKKYNIEVGFEELCLIEIALGLYGRIGMLQFDYLTLCNSLQAEIWTKQLSDEFRNKSDNLKSIFGYAPNSNPGIFNTEIVSDDCRKAIDIYQTIRHQRYLDRMKENPEEESKFSGVDSSPADICQIAGIKIPDFKIK